MAEPTVLTFFYGSYMNRSVLAEVGLEPQRFDTARLPGYDITIGPLANLVAAAERTVYGVLASTTHAELERLYSHARDVLGGVYRPVPVLAVTLEEEVVPALCYIAASLPQAPASADYVGRVLAPARELGFPAWYLRRLESFLPPS